MRKLVTLRVVSAIEPIVGADRIELAHIDGWQCIVNKGEFAVGDVGVFFEIDSFLPAGDLRFSFLSRDFVNYGKLLGARIKTKKVRGALSQGLLLPRSSFSELDSSNFDEDLSKLLNVVKWVRPEEEEPELREKNPNKIKGMVGRKDFPSFVPKTDEERVQNIIGKLKNPEYSGEYQISMKLDGSSTTIYYADVLPLAISKDEDRVADWRNRSLLKNIKNFVRLQSNRLLKFFGRRDMQFGVCSRNFEIIKSDTDNFWKVAIKNDLENKLKKLGRNLALQGELMGPGVCKNREKFQDHDFYLYKVWDIDKQAFMPTREAEALAITLGIKHVPVLGYMELNPDLKVQFYLDMADGPSINNPVREGVVLTRADGKKGFKAISNKYLSKED